MTGAKRTFQQHVYVKDKDGVMTAHFLVDGYVMDDDDDDVISASDKTAMCSRLEASFREAKDWLSEQFNKPSEKS